MGLSRIRRVLPWLAVALLVMMATAHRSHRASLAPGWSASDDRFVQQSEGAVHYRYARMLAQGQELPEVDPMLGAPEGVRPARDFTLLQEMGIATAYRIWARFCEEPPAFQIFVAWALAFMSSWSIVAAFGTARLVHGSTLAGLLGAMFFALAVPAWIRSSGTFLREALGLPLILTAYWLFLADVQRPRNGTRLAAILTASLALGAWHLSGFMALLLLAPAWLAALVRPSPERAVRVACGVAVAALISGVVFTPLRTRLFLLVGPGALLVAGAVGLTMASRVPRRLRVVLVLMAVVSIGVGLFASEMGQDYRHVFDVVLSRIGSPDPASLSFASRAFRSGPFAPPSSAYVLERLLVPAVIGALGWGISMRRRRTEVPGDLVNVVALQAVILVPVVAGMARFSPLLVWFLAVCAAGLFRMRIGRALALGGMALQLWIGFKWDHGGLAWGKDPPQTHVPVPSGPRQAAFGWLRGHAHSDAVVLADFSVSATVLMATDRAVALHPMFERAAARERAQRFYEGLVSPDPSALSNLCREVRADYLLLDVNVLLDRSARGFAFLGGRVALPVQSTLVDLWFYPERIPWAAPVYEDDFTRIYGLSTGRHGPDAGGSGVAECRRIAYAPQRDPRLLDGVFVDSGGLDRLARDLRLGPSLVRRAISLDRAGDREGAVEAYGAALSFLPCDPMLVARARALGVTPADGRTGFEEW